jgi:DMSO/TMAO reductase YedYZ molybdopterin-dependent catalytic subunit
MTTRRTVVQGLAGIGLGAGLGERLIGVAAAGVPPPPAETGLTGAVAGSAEWVTLPGKVPLIKRTFRPPNLETPLEYFRDPITPNKAFFVRYHHANIPQVDPATWALKVGGPAAGQALTFSLAQLRQQFEMVEVTALCLCSGNRRGLFTPHVTGVQWGSGAMGNARWRGVRLTDVLEKAGMRSDTVEVAFDGADAPIMPGAPDFQKSLPLSKALDGNTLIALEMNGERLPPLHGAPARLIVPGWTATYWVKHLTSIELRNTPFDNFWVKTAYRLPTGKFPDMDRFVSQETAVNTPITGIAVNSLITAPATATTVVRRGAVEVRGVAWDGGHGLARVEISLDHGGTWRAAQLGTDLGRYSLRPWSFRVAAPRQPGPLSVRVKATSRNGATQPLEAVANPAGYHHNQIQMLDLMIV